MNGANDHEKLSVNEAAKRAQRNPETVRRWIWSGKLPAEKLDNQLFIDEKDFVSFCRERALLPYPAEAKEDFLEKAIVLRNKIYARNKIMFDSAETIRQMREERTRQIERRLRGR